MTGRIGSPKQVPTPPARYGTPKNPEGDPVRPPEKYQSNEKVCQSTLFVIVPGQVFGANT